MGDALKITGTFLDEISHDIPHQNWGEIEWDRDFRYMWKSHATLTLLAKQDLPTFGYNMIAPLKSWCWGSILFYPFKISRFS